MGLVANKGLFIYFKRTLHAAGLTFFNGKYALKFPMYTGLPVLSAIVITLDFVGFYEASVKPCSVFGF